MAPPADLPPDDGSPAAATAGWLVPLGATAPTIPDPARSPLEAIAAASNERRSEQARQRLADRFDPVAALLDPAGPAVQPITSRWEFSAGDAEQVVDRLLAFDDNRLPRFGFALAGARGVDDRVDFRATYEILRPDVATVAHKLTHGAALILAGVEGHHRSVHDLVVDVEAITGPGASADLVVLGPGGSTQLAIGDDVDALVVVLDGEVELAASPIGAGEVHAGRATIAAGRGAVVRGPQDDPVMASAPAGATIVRIALPRLTTAMLTGLAVDRAVHHPMFRADLPADLEAPVASYGGSLHDRPGALAEAAAQLVDPDLVADVLARARQAMRPATRSGFTQVLDAIVGRTGAVRLAPAGGLLVARDAPGPRLVFAGYALQAERPVQERLAALADGRTFDLAAELRGLDLAPEAAAALAHELVSAGAIEAADPTEPGPVR